MAEQLGLEASLSSLSGKEANTMPLPRFACSEMPSDRCQAIKKESSDHARPRSMDNLPPHCDTLSAALRACRIRQVERLPYTDDHSNSNDA